FARTPAFVGRRSEKWIVAAGKRAAEIFFCHAPVRIPELPHESGNRFFGKTCQRSVRYTGKQPDELRRPFFECRVFVEDAQELESTGIKALIPGSRFHKIRPRIHTYRTKKIVLDGASDKRRSFVFPADDLLAAEHPGPTRKHVPMIVTPHRLLAFWKR